ncbi:MAG: transporter substrate-binding domain-containing protein [Pontiellaceae bacterium]|nr:transporter substrate-binding domain-containing protein [Pontiellaceae bacterium]MBN2786630.1 transporter substrate-binding domain-containing protein [Pontiellaceae bacterium]
MANPFHKPVLLACATALSAAAPAAAAPLSPREATYLEEHEEIVFAVPPAYAPFAFTTRKQFSGMDVELIHWMATEMGFMARFEAMPTEQAIDQLKEGRIDAIVSISYSEKLDDDFDFSQPLKSAPVSLFIRSDRNDIAGFQDLEDANAAVLGSSRILDELVRQGIRCGIRFISSPQEGEALIAAGEVDALVGNELVLQHYLYSTGKGTLKTVGDPLFIDRACIAVAEGNSPLRTILNKGIDSAQNSGTLNKIHAKWLGSDPSGTLISSRTVLMVVLIAAGVVFTILLLILFWNRRLRLSVERHTRLYAESERRLRSIFENSPDAVLLIEEDGQISAANGMACELTGIKKPDLLAKSMYDLLPPGMVEDARSHMRKWFTGELTQCESKIMDALRSAHPVEMTGTLHRINGKETLQLHIRDISMRKEAEQRMAQARRMAEEAHAMSEQARQIAEQTSKAKSEFLANMSHDIRIPLNGILGMTQLLMDTAMTEEQQTCADTIMQSSSGLLKIINHILDLSKIEAGQMEVCASPFSPRSLCTKLCTTFQTASAQKGLDLRCVCEPDVPELVIGDEGLIEQVLVNLIGNAIKFTDRGFVDISIEAPPCSSDRCDLTFRVTDTGIGIEAERHETVFEKYKQINGAGKHLNGGTGLGLAICRQLVELMGGHIAVESAPGQGATFYFTLNLQWTAQKIPPPAKKPEELSAAENANVHVLLVEDNRINQNVAIAMLHKAGFRVTAVNNGQDALERVQKDSFDVVLMDCQMPVMDGYEATRRIRAMKEPVCRIPIIAVTAYALKTDRQRCLDEGMDDYLSKPVSRHELIALLNKYTGKTS